MKKEDKENIFTQLLNKENSVFLIDQDRFEENLQLIHKSFSLFYPKIYIGYSYKTNYIPVICKSSHRMGCWAEVVSEMEVEMALINLTDKSKIIYNGPIKSYDSIKKVMEVGGIINIDHKLDLEYILKILTNQKKIIKTKIAIRLNFTYENHDSRFGLELKQIKELIQLIENNKALELLGYHLHLPFRSLESYSFRIKSLIEILKMHGNKPLKYINIGGGFFGRISPDLALSLNIRDTPDYIDYGKLIGEQLSNYFINTCRDQWPDLFIEPGSSVVADAMWFLSKIHTFKKIENKNILVTYAGRHLVSPTNKTIQFPIELYYSKNSDLQYLEDIHVAGFTCIESDILGKVKNKFKTNEYDFVVLSNVGSYSIVMGSNFILPQPAIYNLKNNNLKIVRAAKTTTSIMSEFLN
jgi:diaminopimelate decarboxylase